MISSRRILACLFCLLAMTFTASVASAAVEAPPQYQERLATLRKLVMMDADRAIHQLASLQKELQSRPETPSVLVAQATVLRMEGDASLRLDRPKQARKFLDKAQATIGRLNGQSQIRGDIEVSLGSLAMKEGSAAEALEYFHRAYRIYRDLKDGRGQSVALQNIASLYTIANDNAQAEKYYREAGDAYVGDLLLTTYLRNNLGNVLLQLEEYNNAEKEYSAALQGAAELKSKILQARISGNLARARLESGDLNGAETFLKRAFQYADADRDPFVMGTLLATKARLLFQMKRLSAAKRVVDLLFSRAHRSEASNYYAHYVAYQVYNAVGDDKKALEHLAAAKRLNDEATTVATSTNAALAAARFDFQNQELRIAKLKAQELQRNVAFERSQSRFERILFLSIGGATLVLLAILTISLITIRRSRNGERDANARLAAANAALEKALAAKTEFLATTSHEIRTPLNGILGMAQVMLADRSLGGATRERIGVVHGAGLAMRALVDDILDVAKMEKGDLTVEHQLMDLCETLRQVAAVWEDQARSRGLSFSLDIERAPRWIESDVGRIRQIIFNLLANALKFTERGEVALVAEAVPGPNDTGEVLRIAVSDTGIGIPADKCEEIFESFKQVDGGTTRKFSGTGLGLAICRNLAEALGGSIMVESELGEGSRFVVTLPLDRAEVPETVSLPQAQENILLVIEPNPIARGMLKRILSQRTDALDFVADAQAARQRLADGSVALLLADEAAFVKDGAQDHELVSEIVRAAHDVGAGVAFMARLPDDSARARLDAAGVDHVIAKPVAGTVLADRLFGNGPTAAMVHPLVSSAA